jgi:hypothetical protein
MSSISGPGGQSFDPDAARARPASSSGAFPAIPEPAPAPPAAPPTESRMDILGRLMGVPKKSPPAAAPPADAQKDVICPVLGAMIAQGKIKLDAKGNMDLRAFDRMLVREMGFSRPLAFMTASAGLAGNRPRDILGNLFGARMNPLELRGGMVKHPGDSMILESGRFDEAKFQALARHATDATVKDGKVVSGRLTLRDLARVVDANVARDAARSGKREGQALGVAEFGAVVTMFGERDPRTGERFITVETLRALYEKKVLPKPAGTAEDPTTVRDYMAVMAEMTRLMPSASPTGAAQAGARAASGGEAPAVAPALLGAAKGVCPHMQGRSAGSAPVNATELRAVAAARG